MTLPWPLPVLLFCGALYLARCAVVVVLAALLRARRG